MDKKTAYKIVFKDLKKVNLFCGKCSNQTNAHFMNGISTVMEFIANQISEELCENFEEEFMNNVMGRILF